MSYGVEQERAATALTGLLATHTTSRHATATVTTAAPAADVANAAAAAVDDQSGIDVQLCRGQLRTAILERIETLAEGDRERIPRRIDLDGIGSDGLHLLHRMMRQTPHSDQLRDQHSPAEVLTRHYDSTRAESWAQAARAVTIGTHDLATATPDHVRSALRPAVNWHLLADTAELVEAFLILDQQLETQGNLHKHTHPDRTWTHRSQRTITSSVAREARWAGTDQSADSATATAVLGAGDGVVLVRDLDSLAAAQQRLSDFLRPRVAYDSSYDPDHELSLHIGRRVTLTQAQINRHLADQTRGRRDGSTERFHTRALGLARIVEASHRYRDLLPPAAAQRRIEAQQLEINHVLPRLASSAHVDTARLTQIENACQDVAVTVARAIRRQATRPNSPYARIGEAPGPVDYKATLPKACKSLIDQAHPTSHWTDRTARDALRDTLRATSTQGPATRGPKRMRPTLTPPQVER